MLVPNTNTRARCTGDDDEAPLRPGTRPVGAATLAVEDTSTDGPVAATPGVTARGQKTDLQYSLSLRWRTEPRDPCVARASSGCTRHAGERRQCRAHHWRHLREEGEADCGRSPAHVERQGRTGSSMPMATGVTMAAAGLGQPRPASGRADRLAFDTQAAVIGASS